MLRWPAASSVERSRPSPGATGKTLVPRGSRGPECRETDSLRAAVTERSANPSRKRHQHAQNSRQEGRPENEVPDQEAIESEKYHADVVGLSIQFEKHQRQGSQLFHLKYAQVLAASQDDQGSELKKTTESQNGASHEAEERR